MKNLIKSRRGIAIEMAIGAMFIMIALSIILISISGMQTRHMKNDLNDFNEKVECYQILDYFTNNNSIASGNVTINHVEYNIAKNEIENETTGDTIIEYVVTDIKSNNAVLTIITDISGKITSWGN